MTETIQNPNINSTSQTPIQTEAETPKTELTGWRMVFSKAKTLLISVFGEFTKSKFYTNKKIFLPVTIAGGLVFFVILLGLIFGKRSNGNQALPTPTPSSIVQSTPEASASGDILSESRKKLNTLRQEINDLDVRQSRLQLPTFDFEIKF